MKSHDLAKILLELPDVIAVAYDPDDENVREVTGVVLENEQVLIETDSDEENT